MCSFKEQENSSKSILQSKEVRSFNNAAVFAWVNMGFAQRAKEGQQTRYAAKMCAAAKHAKTTVSAVVIVQHENILMLHSLVTLHWITSEPFWSSKTFFLKF